MIELYVDDVVLVTDKVTGNKLKAAVVAHDKTLGLYKLQFKTMCPGTVENIKQDWFEICWFTNATIANVVQSFVMKMKQKVQL